MAKTAALVILFYPNNFWVQNIHSYLHYVKRLYIIDNTEISNSFITSYREKISFIHDGFNNGIAKRLNQACNLAIAEGFDFLLTMDQDSFFNEATIRMYVECIENFKDLSAVAMFGINYKSNTSNVDCSYTEVKHLITSGSIINLDAYKKIGGFDENLFIDFVDTDYCFKSILKGYRLIEFSNIFMHHEIGTTTIQTSFKNLKATQRSIHSEIRIYYMVRNFLYLKKKYKKDFKEELSLHKKALVNRIKNKILYGKNLIQIVALIIKARKDFATNKMGKQL